MNEINMRVLGHIRARNMIMKRTDSGQVIWCLIMYKNSVEIILYPQGLPDAPQPGIKRRRRR